MIIIILHYIILLYCKILTQFKFLLVRDTCVHYEQRCIKIYKLFTKNESIIII